MVTIFALVMHSLESMAAFFSISYAAANVVIYFAVIPASFAVLLDFVFRTNAFRVMLGIVALCAFAVCRDGTSVSDLLFSLSVRFLRSFSAIGINYVDASVLVCVVLPASAFAVLLFLAIRTINYPVVSKRQIVGALPEESALAE